MFLLFLSNSKEGRADTNKWEIRRNEIREIMTAPSDKAL